jgi:hypothetical protein
MGSIWTGKVKVVDDAMDKVPLAALVVGLLMGLAATREAMILFAWVS